jgi:hypothetical protein
MDGGGQCVVGGGGGGRRAEEQAKGRKGKKQKETAGTGTEESTNLRTSWPYHPAPHHHRHHQV